ncbi:protein-disulfide reductase DsbD domain-containing protein [Mangrovicoccus ximenensis]|uniref:protein-disulfide reductase DsbD domain-containing protein n=1 Tax=Mangrovicoccus ximenensis TaxID=1911570 RepID=UPI000D3BCB81|nr:protein-disulfide reductase DsbD domain-containing protein [Mangrovicoccus ximenensis]
MKALIARLCLALSASLAALPAAADHNDLVHVDVVDGWVTPQGTVMAGLRIQVADGWKTYWRSPGDVGIPPRFDWSASENLKAVRLHWPRPQVFETFGQRTLGYSGEVVLPVELFPADPAKPVSVAGMAELGLCRDICVAVNQAYFGSNQSAPAAIRSAMAAQPDRGRIASASCQVAPIKDGLRVTPQNCPGNGDHLKKPPQLGRRHGPSPTRLPSRNRPARNARRPLQQAAAGGLTCGCPRLVRRGQDGQAIWSCQARPPKPAGSCRIKSKPPASSGAIAPDCMS